MRTSPRFLNNTYFLLDTGLLVWLYQLEPLTEVDHFEFQPRWPAGYIPEFWPPLGVSADGRRVLVNLETYAAILDIAYP